MVAVSKSINGWLCDTWNGLVMFGVTCTGDRFKNGLVDGFVIVLFVSALNSALNILSVAGGQKTKNKNGMRILC